MSFRTRLSLFFVLIVVVPLLAVAGVLFHLVSDSETGKADARVAEGRAVASGLYAESERDAAPVARTVGSDRALAVALRSGDTAAARARARQLLARTGAERIVVLEGDRAVVDVGAPDAVAPAVHDLVGLSGARLGRLEVSVHDADELSGLVARVTGLDVAVQRDGRPLAATLPPARQESLRPAASSRSRASTTAPLRSARPTSAAGACASRCSTTPRAWPPRFCTTGC